MKVRAKGLLLLMLILAVGSSLLGLGGASKEWTPSVVINEVAWGGTLASYADEWIELYNTTDEEIDLSGWVLIWGEGDVVVHLGEAQGNTKEVRRSVIPAHGFYLLERTDDNTISDIEADLIYKGALDNGGEIMILKDAAGNFVDTANFDGGPWPAGTASRGEPPYASMERISPTLPDAADNWATNDPETARNGLDAEGNPVSGTPGRANSTWVEGGSP